MAIAPLPPSDSDRLALCGAVIDRGMQTFVDVGEALMAIRDDRLYRAHGFPTFEEYCRNRWSFSRQRAYQLIDAAELVGRLSTQVDILPANESQARAIVSLPPAEQATAWEEVREVAESRGITARVVKEIVERRMEQRRNRPDTPQTPPFCRPAPADRFQVIYADPPWRYDYSLDSADNVETHYPTMTAEEIAALPIAALAAPDAVLFLWTTSPKLPDGLRVMAGWGFDYRSSAVWVKPGCGMGYYFRVNHEILLLGVRGHPGVPLYEGRTNSDFHAPRGRHSEKPLSVACAIEKMYPDARRVELFARAERPGWLSWGDGVPGS